MLRKLLFRLATWRDPRFQVQNVDELDAIRMVEDPSIENSIRLRKALACLRYAREMKS